MTTVVNSISVNLVSQGRKQQNEMLTDVILINTMPLRSYVAQQPIHLKTSFGYHVCLNSLLPKYCHTLCSLNKINKYIFVHVAFTEYIIHKLMNKQEIKNNPHPHFFLTVWPNEYLSINEMHSHTIQVMNISHLMLVR